MFNTHIVQATLRFRPNLLASVCDESLGKLGWIAARQAKTSCDMGVRMTIFFGEEPGMDFEAAQHSTETFPDTLDEGPAP